MLFFKQQFFDKVKTGEKTSTIRLRANCKIGDIVTCLCGREKLKIKVKNIENLSFSKLTLDSAKTEGFISKGQLKRVLMTLYPNKQEFVYIQFELWHDH